MKTLYFSSTGNCLYFAKELGGENFAIPKLISENKFSFKDDVIGIVFPIYGLCIPPYIEEFFKKSKLNAIIFLQSPLTDFSREPSARN